MSKDIYWQVFFYFYLLHGLLEVPSTGVRGESYQASGLY